MSKPEDKSPDEVSPNEQPTIAVSPDGTAVPEPARQQAGQTAADSAKPTATQPSAGISMSEQKTTSVPAQAPVVIKQSSGKGLAAGALVLALLGLGASGFLFVQGQNVLKTQELNVEQKLDKAALGESNNAGTLQESLRRQSQIEAALTQLGGTVKQNTDQIGNSQRAYQELLKSRANWLVDETEATLNMAAQQLMLSGNVPVAVNVLQSIESRLSRFEQPELLPIKQAVSSDLAALQSRPYLDVSSASLRLSRLETAVTSLPLAVDSTLQPGKAPEPVAAAASQGWWQNAWDKTLNSLKGLVEVRKLNSSDAMLMAPEQVYFARENLRLRLLDARVALMQRNGEVYQADLNEIEAAVKQYFAPNSPVTQSWLKELADLKALDVRMVSDDALKASIAAVRTFQNAVRTNINLGNNAATAASEVPAAKPASAEAASAPAAAPASAAHPPAASASAPAAGSSAKEAAPAEKPAQPATDKPALKGDQA